MPTVAGTPEGRPHVDHDPLIRLVRRRADDPARAFEESVRPGYEKIQPFDCPAGTSRCWRRASEPVDKKTFHAAVAERAGLSKEEAADLTRATLENLAGQVSGGEVQQLAVALPDWLEPHVPRHDGRARPKPLTEFVRDISRRTGLKEDETRRGVRALLVVLREAMDPTHLDHALSMLPKDYRQLEAA
jgi:uncharacterized protein (DUF2267 family)